MELLLFPSLWLVHSHHGPQPLQLVLRAFRSPRELLSPAHTQPASTTGHCQMWLTVSTTAGPAGHGGSPAPQLSPPRPQRPMVMYVWVWGGRGRASGGIQSLLILYSLLKSSKVILWRYQKKHPFPLCVQNLLSP